MDTETKDLILYFAVGMCVILLIALVVMIIYCNKSKESYGSLQRRKILAERSLYAPNDCDQSKTEGYAWSRTGSLFPGQFDYLIANGKECKDFKQSDKLDVAKSIGQQAVNTIKEVTGLQQPAPEQVAEEQTQLISEKIPDQNDVVTDLVDTEKPELQVEETQDNKDYEVEPTSSNDVGLVENDNVVANSGNSIESSKPENFGYSRVYNNFNYLNGDVTVCSAVAQNENEEQKDINMQTFINKFR